MPDMSGHGVIPFQTVCLVDDRASSFPGSAFSVK